MTIARILIRSFTIFENWLQRDAAAVGKLTKRIRRNAALSRLLAKMDRFWLARLLKYRIEHHIIASSISYLFDEAWYRRDNPDLALPPGLAIKHFVSSGAAQQRQPHPLFDTQYYVSQLQSFPKKINPLVHYFLVGRHLKISPTPWFSWQFYLDSNQDVANSKISAFEHFVRFGIYENRSASERFDPHNYVLTNEGANGAEPVLLQFLERQRKSALGEQSFDYRPRQDDKLHAPTNEDMLKSILSIKRPVDDEVVLVDIVIPVYNNYALTLSCIEHVLRSTNTTPCHVIVIDDCSPAVKLAAALEEIAEKGLITLIRNKQNKGFVSSVNTGMSLHANTDVILLNSDVEVFGNWVDRLRAIAISEAGIATVCPLTNSGTICSYPNFCADNHLPSDISARELDQLVTELHAGQHVPAPTAVGFCMYIKRQAIREVGLFDEAAFGAGYGEENDFCLRAQRKGWRDVIAMDTFVFHFGSASFRGRKLELVKRATKIIDQRYPGYAQRVQSYVKQDPARLFRSRIDIARLQRLKREKNVAIVSHSRGGGTEQLVQQNIARHKSNDWTSFRIFADPQNRNLVRLSHKGAQLLPNLKSFDLRIEGDIGEFADLLNLLGISALEIHHLVEFSAQAPAQFVGLAKAARIPFHFYVHDYMSVCPRINLVDRGGMYCGEPDAKGCNRCLRRRGSEHNARDILGWRSSYGHFLAAASTITVPNEDVRNRLQRYYAGLSFDVISHDAVKPAPLRMREWIPKDAITVGVIGAVSPIKGLGVLLACARSAKSQKLPLRFVVVGYTSDDVRTRQFGIEVTGPYSNDRVKSEIERMAIDVIFIASTVPETHCYTLSIALTTGLPVIAFDIGAVGRRLAGVENARLIPLDKAHDALCLNQIALEFYEERNQAFRNHSVVA